ncbi:acyl carrier protein [Streptomyces sp. IBSBF 2953]|uniref:Lct26 n=1 Tax=Streptomyces rishiriensis TaxID=68264 RepID=B0LJ09_STRRH|nr:acyl carrier protein [Streptomyces scabiei]ABX71109.1 Lct26 [Streptomyces rishiriensis]MCQ9184093.1 acyl carrier protein [Streptomyces hayashii]MDX3117015.1 acyl carrier protein [Streptomyces scabiei]
MAPTGVTRSRLHDILATHIGLEPEVVDGATDSSLADLGVDSIGLIELQKAVSDEYDTELPDEAHAWSLDQIIDHLNSTTRKAS